MKTLQVPIKKIAVHTKLVEEIRLGSKQCFKQLYLLYYEMLVKFVCSYVHDLQTAENIAQDVFVKIWINRSNLNSSLNIKSFLFKIAKNQSLMHLRHVNMKLRNAGKVKSCVSPIPTPEELFHNQNMHDCIHAAIEELPEKCREVFVMNRIDGLKYAEIAEILTLSIKTVEAHMGRAYKYLRKSLSFLKI